MKKTKKFNNSFMYVILFILLLVGLFFLIKFKNKSNHQLVTSDLLNISIEIPSNFEVIERFNRITIENEKGKIYVDRIGSLYPNLEEHLRGLSDKNGLEIKILENYSNSFSKIKINHSNSPLPEDITYMIYIENSVYSFQTTSEELYSDLDAIAKSFRYNP